MDYPNILLLTKSSKSFISFFSLSQRKVKRATFPTFRESSIKHDIIQEAADLNQCIFLSVQAHYGQTAGRKMGKTDKVKKCHSVLTFQKKESANKLALGFLNYFFVHLFFVVWLQIWTWAMCLRLQYNDSAYSMSRSLRKHILTML